MYGEFGQAKGGAWRQGPGVRPPSLREQPSAREAKRVLLFLEAAAEWLLDSIFNRSIGAVAVPGFSLTNCLTKDYDALIFFDRTTPSYLLPF